MEPARQIRNLTLVGFMGVGKTTVGHMVAVTLGFQMVDTDQLIEERAGRRISEIFATDGEPRFREMEAGIVSELAGRSRLVVSTGGGVVTNPANVASLKRHSLIVCLWASPEAIWQRVGHQNHRPLLQDPDPLGKIRSLLAAREPFYRQADVLVNTELRSLREVTQQVVHQYQIARRRHGQPGLP